MNAPEVWMLTRFEKYTNSILQSTVTVIKALHCQYYVSSPRLENSVAHWRALGRQVNPQTPLMVFTVKDGNFKKLVSHLRRVNGLGIFNRLTR
jgi:hypothetical protein